MTAFMVFLGSWLSSFGNAILLDSFSRLVLNPWILWQYLHNMIAAVVTGSIVMASIGAY